jgi:hypothetical protein
MDTVQGKRLARFMAALYLPFLCFLWVLGFVSARTGIPLTSFMREPQAVVGGPFYIGIASMLGGFLWSAAAAVCLFRWDTSRGMTDQIRARFLLFWGLVSILLLLDDAFQMHEEVFPRWFGLGQKVSYAGYGTLLLAGIVIFKDVFLKTEYFLFLFALAFFALSISVDLVQELVEPVLGEWRILLEDGFKLLGIVSWLAYFWRTSANRHST